MDISDVSKRTGIPSSALRYYERKGLLRSARGNGGRRRFAADVEEQLALIALGQAAGLSLDEIGSMLSPHGPPVGTASPSWPPSRQARSSEPPSSM